MKNKKLFLPAMILAVAIIVITIYSLISSMAFKPTVVEGEFPFSITYELDGEVFTIKDTYKVHYVGNGGYADTKTRIYSGELESSGKNDTLYTLKKDENTRVELWTHFYPDYLMGDSEYDYFDDEAFEPKIYYYNAEEQEFSDEETLALQGVKLISFEYPMPIENSFAFSHLSYFSSEVVLPTLLIAILSLIVMIIFIRKEKELKYKEIDIISTILAFLTGFILVPFVTVVALLIDINGGSSEFLDQVLYFMPACSVLFIAASVALRRKGYGTHSLFAELFGPVVFVVYLIVYSVCGLL